MTKSIHYTLAELRETAQIILKNANSKTLLFKGEMGSGKTTLISALVKELGGSVKTSSPTFSIVNEYELPNALAYHFDFYRIKDPYEALDMGIEDYFAARQWNFIEWPDKVFDILPQQSTFLDIAIAEDGGRILNISEKNQSTG
jgi:tRNA threonylcarbamoyladenosine biosynthesis protein TsaE|tara:strand:- start:24695 stop:25126 length:432 start_codon:yes stop_codon:yes gene_type:complete